MDASVFNVEEIVQTILSIVGNQISQSDTLSWGTIFRSSGSGSSKRYSIIPLSDAEQVVDDLINQTGFNLEKGDVVLIYKIQNQWSNALIIAKKNISFEEKTPVARSNSTSDEEKEQNLEPNSTERNLYYYGPSDGFSTFYMLPSNGELCSVSVELADFYITVDAQWNYGQPFDGGLIYNNISQWLNWGDSPANALNKLKDAHQVLGLDQTPITRAIMSALYNVNSSGPTGIFNFISDKVGTGDILLVARKSPFDLALDEDVNFRVLNTLCNYRDLMYPSSQGGSS